jgi:hypothetical protein
MGLLDDAIREHLELKRLRGADPGDVAREEQDALGPVPRKGEGEHSRVEDGEPKSAAEAAGSFSPDPESAVAASNPGQETIEINMEAELAAETEFGEAGNPKEGEQSASVAHRVHAPGAAEDSLEWEMPGDVLDETASEAGEAAKVDSRVADDHGTAEPVEDVLEETPDFLRDTPEQERLWFEQRPPRDFDFNE